MNEPRKGTIVVIPAREQSERLPGKPLADIAGKPMVVRVWERASQARGIDRVLVATDSPRIAEVVRAAGGEAVMTSSDCASGTDRCAEAVRGLAGVEVVINVQGDEPLLEPSVVEALARAFEDASVCMATLARPLLAEERENPNVVKVVRDLRGDALYFSRAPIPFARAEGAEPLAHVGLYGYRRDFLEIFAALPPTPLERTERLEQLRALEHGHRIRVLRTDYRSIGVDTPEDLERVRAIFSGSGVSPSRTLV